MVRKGRRVEREENDRDEMKRKKAEKWVGREVLGIQEKEKEMRRVLGSDGKGGRRRKRGE